MRRVLIVECQQEVSSFNPVPSGYGDFQVNRGAETRDLEINSGDAEVHTTLKPPLPDGQQPRLDGGPRIEIPKSAAPVPKQP